MGKSQELTIMVDGTPRVGYLVTFEGPLNTLNAPKIKESRFQLREHETALTLREIVTQFRVRFSLGGVTEVSNSGLATIFRLTGEARGVGREIEFVNVSPSFREAFDRVVESYPPLPKVADAA